MKSRIVNPRQLVGRIFDSAILNNEILQNEIAITISLFEITNSEI